MENHFHTFHGGFQGGVVADVAFEKLDSVRHFGQIRFLAGAEIVEDDHTLYIGLGQQSAPPVTRTFFMEV